MRKLTLYIAVYSVLGGLQRRDGDEIATDSGRDEVKRQAEVWWAEYGHHRDTARVHLYRGNRLGEPIESWDGSHWRKR